MKKFSYWVTFYISLAVVIGSLTSSILVFSFFHNYKEDHIQKIKDVTNNEAKIVTEFIDKKLNNIIEYAKDLSEKLSKGQISKEDAFEEIKKEVTNKVKELST